MYIIPICNMQIFLQMNEATHVKVLEFYCGIGGTHFALNKLSTPTNVISAFDINTTTNVIYKHNFPSTKLCQNNIQGLTVSSLEKLNADLWTMSPPCQPFTMKGNRKGEDDRRCDSFKMLLSSLSEMIRPPQWIFIENVSGFYGTSMHSVLMTTLKAVGYQIEEYDISPVQFGIPNSRPRYYALASLKKGQMLHESHICRDIDGLGECESTEVGHYLTTNNDVEYLHSEKIQQNKISIVDPSSMSSTCFTKSYTQYLVGCGSYVRDSKGIRPFSPREVASLMCFPQTFSWPPNLTHKQLYRALGNSVNVTVVSKLLERLFTI